MRMRTRTIGELLEFVQKFSDDPDVLVEVNLDGHTFDIDYIELDTDDVIRIHLKK